MKIELVHWFVFKGKGSQAPVIAGGERYNTERGARDAARQLGGSDVRFLKGGTPYSKQLADGSMTLYVHKDDEPEDPSRGI